MSDKTHEALALTERLIKLTKGDSIATAEALALRDQIRMPLSKVLQLVPGHNVSEKCRKLGISRQTYYGWMNGRSRPNHKFANRLAKLTGLRAAEIRGRSYYYRVQGDPHGMESSKKSANAT
jgi:transcriptional regulator with XRE-family HTH domain